MSALETMPRWLQDRGGRPLKSGDAIVMVNGDLSGPDVFTVASGRDGGRVSHAEVFRAMRDLDRIFPRDRSTRSVFDRYVPVESRGRRGGYRPALLPRHMVLRPDLHATLIQRAWRGHRDRRRASISAALGSMHRGEQEGRLPHLPPEVRSSILRRSSLMLPEDRHRDEPIGLAGAGYQRRARPRRAPVKRSRKAPATKRARRARK